MAQVLSPKPKPTVKPAPNPGLSELTTQYAAVCEGLRLAEKEWTAMTAQLAAAEAKLAQCRALVGVAKAQLMRAIEAAEGAPAESIKSDGSRATDELKATTFPPGQPEQTFEAAVVEEVAVEPIEGLDLGLDWEYGEGETMLHSGCGGQIKLDKGTMRCLRCRQSGEWDG